MLKQYYEWSENNSNWNNHNFSKFGAEQLSFCKQGLPEVCGNYGTDFAIELYTQRDASKAEKYLKYAINNTKHEGLRIKYEYALAAAKDLARYDSGSVINAIKSNFWNYYSDCRDMIGVNLTIPSGILDAIDAVTSNRSAWISQMARKALGV